MPRRFHHTTEHVLRAVDRQRGTPEENQARAARGRAYLQQVQAALRAGEPVPDPPPPALPPPPEPGDDPELQFRQCDTSNCWRPVYGRPGAVCANHTHPTGEPA